MDFLYSEKDIEDLKKKNQELEERNEQLRQEIQKKQELFYPKNQSKSLDNSTKIE